MTIQMLRQWNGLEAGSIQTLTSGEETRLITAGLARAYTRGMDGISDPVSGVRNARRTRVRTGTFGDSTANPGIAAGPCNTVTGSFPASGATTIGFQEASKWAAHLFYPQAQLVFNGGVSGAGTADMLGRDVVGATNAAASIHAMSSASLDAVIYRGSSINDFAAGATPAAVSAGVDVAITNHRRILSRLSSLGVPILDVGCYGYGVGTAATSAIPDEVRAGVVRLRAAQAAMAADFPLVTYLDPVSVGIGGVDGAILPSVTNDGVHLSSTGGLHLGIAEAGWLTDTFGPAGTVAYPGTSLYTSAVQMQSTVALAGGGVRPSPDYNVTADNGGAVTNGRVVDVPGQGQMWLVDVDVQAGTTQIVMYLPAPPLASGVAAGAVLGVEFGMYLETPDGVGLNVLGSRLDMTKTAAGRLINAGVWFGVPVGTHRPPAKIVGRHVLPPLLMPEAFTALSASNLYSTTAVVATSPCRVTVGVGIPRAVVLS